MGYRKIMDDNLVREKLRKKPDIPDFWSEIGLDVDILVVSNCEINTVDDSKLTKKQTVKNLTLMTVWRTGPWI